MTHTLPTGRHIIDALEELGEALGYSVIREHEVGRGAAVDLSWTAAEYNDIPLFVFEVESTASAGIANNTMKVFGKSLESMVKPLFFFHVVAKAGPANNRIAAASRAWGTHNYRVYRMSDASQRLGIIADVLAQHRRVSNRLNILDVVSALRRGEWGDDDFIRDVLQAIVDLRFDAPHLHAFAWLAVDDAGFLPVFTDRLLALESSPTVPAREGYDGGPGEYIPGLLEGALLVATRAIADREGPAWLEGWSTSSGSFPRMIDAAFGLNRDYDGFIVDVAPFQYALAAAAFNMLPQSRAWVVRDLHRLLEAERRINLPAELCLPAAIWLAYVVASHADCDPTHAFIGQTELQEMYQHAGEVISAAGGLPATWLGELPAPSSDIDVYRENLKEGNRTGRVALLALEDLQGAAADGTLPTCETAAQDAIRWLLLALVSVESYGRSSRDLVALLFSGSTLCP